MRGKFISQLADDVLKENHHWKQECTKIQNKLRDYESTMLQALDQSGYDQVNILMDPQQTLQAFCDKLASNVRNNRSIRSHNDRLLRNVSKLEEELDDMGGDKTSLQVTIRKNDRNLETANRDYEIKIKIANEKLDQLKKHREKSLIEIDSLRKKNETISSDLVALNRQKIHQLVVSHKNQMMQYRRTVEEEGWKMESSLRNQLDSKNDEIRKLITNIDRLKRSDKLYEKDWLILENLMKPYSEHTILVERIAQLRNSIAQVKSENRNATNKSLQLQIDKSQLLNEQQRLRQKLKSYGQRFGWLQEEHDRIKEQLQKELDDKGRLTKYYDDKWVHEFNQVKTNLEKKFSVKNINLEREYDERKRSLQNEILTFQTQNKRLRVEMCQLRQRILENQKKIEAEVKARFLLLDRISQLKRNIKETQFMFREDVLVLIQREKNEIQRLEAKVESLRSELRREYQRSDENIALKQAEHKNVINQVKQGNKRAAQRLEERISKLTVQNEDKVRQIQEFETKQKVAVEFVKIEYDLKMDHRLDVERDIFRKEFEQQRKDQLDSENKLYMKIREGEYKLKQLGIKKQEFKTHYEEKEYHFKKSIQQREKMIEELRQKVSQMGLIKNEFQNEIEDKKHKLADSDIEIKSLDVMIQSKQAQIYSLNLELKEIVRERNSWNRLLKNTQKEFVYGFRQIKESCDKLINFYKSRIWEMERMLERHPISEKDFEKIKKLSDQCKKLEDKVEIKQAENLILNQVKDYYEHKVTEAEFQAGVEVQLKNKSVFVKRPSKRRQGLVSLKKTATERSITIFDSKEIADLQRYIKSRRKQAEGRESASASKDYRRERNKSSML